MANIYSKTMREALQEAREYRDVAKEGGPGSGPQKGNPGSKYSDKQIKQAYGILNDPRYKQGNYSGAAKAIDKLAKGLSSHPDVKNALKRANEGLDLPATGDTTTSNASQEIEEAADKSSAEYKAGLAAAEKGEKYDTNPHAPGRNRLNWSMGHNQFRADALRKAGKPNYGARGQFEETDIEGEELSEAWNEKLSKKGLEQYRTMYKSLSKSGIDTKWIKALEKLYDDIVIGGMYSSRSAEDAGILKIDGRTKYKNANW